MHTVPLISLGRICFWGEGKLLYEYPTAFHGVMFRTWTQDTRNSPEKTRTTFISSLYIVNPVLHCTLLFQIKKNKSANHHFKVYSFLAPLSNKRWNKHWKLGSFPHCMFMHVVFFENHWRFTDFLQINIYKLIPINWLCLDKDSYQKVHPHGCYSRTTTRAMLHRCSQNMISRQIC